MYNNIYYNKISQNVYKIGPTYLLAACTYNLLAQLYLIRVADASLMELAGLLSLAQAVGIFSL
jgi:hypothetical protein